MQIYPFVSHDNHLSEQYDEFRVKNQQVQEKR